ncbi:unnamed protein product [Brassica oleracea]|uniref:(rape) hypothetical protein n=1 Tax=Brassica napus TaxID=3708 RepID=A0A816UBJ2_BRANA|nr:unnamed protein product [Brassica napus]
MLDLSKFPKIICQRFKCKITYSYIIKNTKEKVLRSGFGWDSTTQRFTAPKEVWTEYLKVKKFIRLYYYFFGYVNFFYCWHIRISKKLVMKPSKNLMISKLYLTRI